MAIQFTNGTLAQWTAAGKVLLNGQLGVLRNADGTVQIKIGNGVDTWASLPAQDSVKSSAQSLTSGQQDQARANIGAVGVKEAPLTPYRFGATGPGLAVNNTTPIANMFAAASTAGTAAEIYFPPGDWVTQGSGTGGALPLVPSLAIRGAGRQLSRLRVGSSGSSLFQWNTDVSGVRIEDLYLDGASSNAHIFEPGSSGGIHGSTFKNLFLNQQVDGKAIWYQDNSGSFIHLTFEEVEMQRTATSTQIPFYVRSGGGAANCNLFKQVRLNGLNNTNTVFMHFESTLSQTYLTDWEFVGIVGEQNRAGLIKMVAACGVTMIAVTDEDATGAYVADVLRFEANGLGLAPADITLISSTRRGSTLNGGVREIYVDSAARNVTLIACNPTPSSATATVSVPSTTTMIGMRLPDANGLSNVRSRPRRTTVSTRRQALSGYPFPMGNAGSVSLAKDSWRFMPLSVETGLSVTNLAVLLITAATGGTCDMKFALYSANADGTPGSLVTTYTPTVDLSTGSGTEKATSTLSSGERSIPAGEWFIGCAWTGTATANPAISPLVGTHPSVAGASVGANQNAYQNSTSGGTPPSPAGASTTPAQGICVWGVLT